MNEQPPPLCWQSAKLDTSEPERYCYGEAPLVSSLRVLLQSLRLSMVWSCTSLSTLKYLFPSPVKHVCRRDIGQRLVVAPIVVVADEEARAASRSDGIS